MRMELFLQAMANGMKVNTQHFLVKAVNTNIPGILKRIANENLRLLILTLRLIKLQLDIQG